MPVIAIACSDTADPEWLPLPQPIPRNPHGFRAGDRASGVGQRHSLGTSYRGRRAVRRRDRTQEHRLGRAITEAGYWLGPWPRPRHRRASNCRHHRLGARLPRHWPRGGLVATATPPRWPGPQGEVLHEGTLRRAGYVDDGKADLIIFSRLDDDPDPVLTRTIAAWRRVQSRPKHWKAACRVVFKAAPMTVQESPRLGQPSRHRGVLFGVRDRLAGGEDRSEVHGVACRLRGRVELRPARWCRCAS